MIQSSRGFQEPFVRQITFFLQNRVGQLADVLRHLGNQDIIVHALSVFDSVDYAVIRMVVDKTDKAIATLDGVGVNVSENMTIAVEVREDGSSLLEISRALLSGEINLHYMYPMISRPNGRSVVLIRLDDLELGVEILDKRGFTTIGHGELMDHTDETESGAW